VERTGKDIPATVRLLHRLMTDPKESVLRAQVLGLLNLQAHESFKIEEAATDPASLLRAYQPVFAWFAKHFPSLVRTLAGDEEPDPGKWALLLKSAPWSRGDPTRGQALFEQRGCQTCHAGATTIGPDLGGVTSRLSTNDLFSAILFPSRDIAEVYRPTVFQTRDGQSVNGIVVFESADGVMVQTSATSTVRLADADIVSRRPSSQSLMPSGLLAGLGPQDLADLYGFLRMLKPRGQP
jgi:putative heme-binding domain-containing protein